MAQNNTEKPVETKAESRGKIIAERFLKFLMYGGWLLVLFIVVGIVILVTTC